MRPTLLFLLALPFFAGAQKPSTSSDSADYYRQQMYQLERTLLDSLRRSEQYIYLRDRAETVWRPSGDYTAVTAFFDVAGADYDKLNSSITQSGFDALPNTAVRLGYGVSYQFDRGMFDLAFFAFGLRNTTQKAGEKIVANFSGFFQFDLGYDLIAAKWINVYPYAGFSYRTSLLSYKKDPQLNSSFTDVTNIVVNDQSVRERCNKLGYQAGLGLDLVVSEQRRLGGGVMLFVKAGTNRIFGKEVYDIDGTEYKPGIQYGNWIATFGIKLFGRN
jgi:hypothetical protein